MHALVGIPQDFNIEMRIDLFATRNADLPQGNHPASVLVRDGFVDLSDVATAWNSGTLPTTKPYEAVMKALSEMQGYSLSDFVVSLFNLSQMSHMDLAVKLFAQVGAVSWHFESEEGFGTQLPEYFEMQVFAFCLRLAEHHTSDDFWKSSRPSDADHCKQSEIAHASPGASAVSWCEGGGYWTAKLQT